MKAKLVLRIHPSTRMLAIDQINWCLPLATFTEEKDIAMARALVAACDSQDYQPGDNEIDVKEMLHAKLRIFGFPVHVNWQWEFSLYIEDVPDDLPIEVVA